MSKRTFWAMGVLWYYCKLIILVFHDAMHMWVPIERLCHALSFGM